MKRNYFFKRIFLFLFLFFSVLTGRTQCDFLRSTISTVDTVIYSFTGGSFQSYGCAPIDPTRWLSGNSMSVTAAFVNPQNHPAFRVWGMNDDDSISILVNGSSYPLNAISASYAPKVVCGVSPGPNGVLFANGKLVGSNTNVQGNYSYSDVTINSANVNSIKVNGVNGAGWGFAGVLLYCSPLSITEQTFSDVNVFPNPVSDILTLQGINMDHIPLIFYNELGERVKDVKQVNSGVDVSGLKPGVYFLQLNTNDQVIIKRIVKF